MADLLEHLELPQCTCLNMATDHTLRHCLESGSRDDASMFLESDADEELVIHLKFMQAVKISHLHIAGVEGDTAPNKVRLFVNKVGLDFDSAKSDKPTQELNLSKTDVVGAGGVGAPVELRFVLFQKVQELDIFVPSNHGDGEVTQISKLLLVGAPIEQSGLKRSAEQQKAASDGDWGSSPKM